MPLDGRFVDRVCAEGERARIRAAPEPRRALWRAWAAKEAAYKVVSKRLGSPPPFVHARFRVDEHATGRGTVTFRDLSVPFREEPTSDADALHLVAWHPADSPTIEAAVEPLPPGPAPLHRLSERERRAVHSAASGWVRLTARARASVLLGRPDADLQIVCDDGPPGRAAPRLLVGGRATGWDVSLSHHGRWVAWALCRGGSPATAGS